MTKRFVLSTLKIIFLFLAFALISVGVWVWFFPAQVVGIASEFLNRSTDIVLKAGAVSGNPHRGWQFDNLHIKVPPAVISISRVNIRFGWEKIFRRQLILEELNVVAPRIEIGKQAPKRKKPAEPPKEKVPSKNFLLIRHVRVSSGTLVLLAGKTPLQVRDVDIDLKSDHDDFLATVTGEAHAFFQIRKRQVLSVNLRAQEGVIDAKTAFNVRRAEMDPWLPKGGADLRGYGSAQGKWPHVLWKINVSVEEGIFPPFQLKHGRISASGFRVPPQRITAQAALFSIRRGSSTIDSIDFDVDGGTSAHRLQLMARQQNGYFRAKGKGAYADSIWTVRWSVFQGQGRDVWGSTRPFVTQVGPNLARVSDLSLMSREAGLKLNAHLQGKKIERFEAVLRHFDLSTLSDWKLVPTPLSGQVNGSVKVRGSLKSPQAEVKIRTSTISIDGQRIGTISLNSKMNARRIHIDEFGIRTNEGFVRLDGNLPLSFGGKKIQPFTLHLRSSRFDPGLLSPLFPRIKIEKSNLETNLKLVGTPSEFSADGMMSFTADKVSVKEAGIALQGLVFDVAADGERLNIKQARATSEEGGMLFLDGFVTRRKSQFGIHARKFAFKSPAGFAGEFNADIACTGAWNSPVVAGEINILSADYTPPKKKKEKSAPKKEPSKPSSPSPLAADIHIKFDRDVWYKDGQSSIEAKGDVRIKKEANEGPLLLGSVETLRGTYFFYGRAFEVERGRVVFTGEPKPNPILDVETKHVNEATKFKVTLSVTGTAQEPVLKLSSEPPLEEMDIIAVLVTGRPISDTNEEGESDGDTETAAKLYAANFLAEKLRQRLQTELDIDVFQFKMGEEGTADVTMGKNLSRDLYVSFSQTLEAEGQQRVEAEYDLSKHWSLDGTTSSLGNYVVDFLFKFGFY